MWLYYVRRYKHVIWGVLLAIVLMLLVVIGVKTTSIKKAVINEDVYSGKAMGTAIKKTIYSEKKKERDAVNTAIDDCLRTLEKQISVRISDSEIAKCNRSYVKNGTYRLPENIVFYLQEEMKVAQETKGAFSPCVRPLSVLWGIEDGKNVVPDQQRIEEKVKYASYSKIAVSDDGIIFKLDNMAIDLGAAGKGIACDEVMKTIEESKVEGAVVSIGGSVAIFGSKGDGKPWHIGIRDPRGGEDDVMGVVDCADHTFVSTSGDYEKYFEENFKRYHHIFDPRTGYPVDNELMSVTIIGDNGFMSDVLSTTCFVLGLKSGMEYAQKKGVEGIFITKDKEVYITKGIKKEFRIKDNQYILAN
ncbi:MAG: FAD:protein FMN transferase [Eubacteriales bacterium]|nr:FAD:protein FMN transferase [Eubacteriales bacterium]